MIKLLTCSRRPLCSLKSLVTLPRSTPSPRVLAHFGALALFAVASVSQADSPSQQTTPLTLERVLEAARQAPRSVEFAQLRQAVESEIRSRDLLLAPRITALGEASRDQRPRSETQQGLEIQRGKAVQAKGSLEKPFSSGTTLSVSTAQQVRDTLGGAREGSGSTWEVRIEQALLRDRFGAATMLRYESERLERSARLLDLEAKQQAFLEEVDQSYWDYIAAERTREIRRANVRRSQELVSWMEERVARFAAEDTDLLQVRALLAQREIEFSESENQIAQRANHLRALVPQLPAPPWLASPSSLSKERRLSDLHARIDLIQEEIPPNSGYPLSLDALATWNGSQQLRIKARQIEDAQRSSLNAFVAYGGGGLDDSLLESIDDSTTSSRNAAIIGVRFEKRFGSHLMGEELRAAELTAAAEEQRAAALVNDSARVWSDIQQNLSSLSQQARMAHQLISIQQAKVSAERGRLEQGKSTTLQLTSFENELSESELRWISLLAAARREEARVRRFAHKNETVVSRSNQ